MGRMASWTWSGAPTKSNSLTTLYAAIAVSYETDA
jgi:hypothetical protein